MRPLLALFLGLLAAAPVVARRAESIPPLATRLLESPVADDPVQAWATAEALARLKQALVAEKFKNYLVVRDVDRLLGGLPLSLAIASHGPAHAKGVADGSGLYLLAVFVNLVFLFVMTFLTDPKPPRRRRAPPPL